VRALKVGTRRADVEVLQKKKQWALMKLIMLEEVKLISWSACDDITKGGAVLEFSDISHIAVTDAGKKEADKENVVKIMSKRGEFCIAFKTFQKAGDYSMALLDILRSLFSLPSCPERSTVIDRGLYGFSFIRSSPIFLTVAPCLPLRIDVVAKPNRDCPLADL
jgi:hypothetical protein